MRLVCSYCRRTIREDGPAHACDVRHGMCAGCADHFERLWRGTSLAESLDTLPQPVLVMTPQARVVAANRKVAALLGRDHAELRGLLGGEALACVHSRLPDGCWKSVHCRVCPIRRAVTQVAETGVSLDRIAAYLVTDGGRVDLRISVQPKESLVRVVVDELGPTRPLAPAA